MKKNKMLHISWLKNRYRAKKYQRILSKILCTTILISNLNILSFAGILSEDTRYETFEGHSLKIEDIIEDDDVDVEVNGNTLINIATDINYNNYVINGGTIVNGVYTSDDSVQWSGIHQESGINLYKPNTEYTLFFSIDSNTHVNDMYVANHSASYNSVFENEYTIPAGTVGDIKVKLRTRSDLSGIIKGVIIFGGTGSGKFTISNLMVIEGDHLDKDLEYFKGIQSVGEKADKNHSIRISSKNKNLLNLNIYNGVNVHNNGICTITDDSIKITTQGTTNDNVDSYMDTGIIVSRELIKNRYSKYLIKAKENTDYTLSYKVNVESVNNHDFFIDFRDINYNLLRHINNSGLSKKTNSFTVTSPENTAYINIRFDNNAGGNTLEFYNIQLEEGKEATEYRRYNESISNIPLSEPLRSLPNGVSDKIIKKDNKWVIERNVDEFVLNGSENWFIDDDRSNLPTVYFRTYTDKNYPNEFDESYNNKTDFFVNDKYPLNTANHNWGLVNADSPNLDVNKSITISIRDERMSLADFKTKLANNPVTVLCQKVVPTYEELNINLSMPIYENVTYISNGSNVPANLKVTVDRVLNRAIEFTDIAVSDNSIENQSNARYWVNLLAESLRKDNLQSQLNGNINFSELVIEPKNITSSTDIYFVPQNNLSMSLSTNYITFDNFSGVEDMEKLNAIDITINSTLPYELNASLPVGIYNANKDISLPLNILSIKESSNNDYELFSNIDEKIILETDNLPGENKHSIDLKLNGKVIDTTDVYKATIKFEAKQK